MLAVDPRKLDEIPERIVDMMGYKVMYPFTGFADAPRPRKGEQEDDQVVAAACGLQPTHFCTWTCGK